MSYNSLIVFNSAMDKIRQGTQDVQAINLARANLAQKQQQLDIQKKESDLKLQTGALTNQQTAMEMKNTQAMMDQYFKNQNDQLDGQGAQIDQQEHQSVTDLRQAHSVAAQLFNTDPDVKSYATSGGAPAPSSPMSAPDVASAYTGAGAGAITDGPQGGTIVGQDASNSPQSDTTPNAVSSLFGNLPAVGSMKPYVNGQGKIAMKNITQADNEGQMLQTLVNAKAKGIPLNADETAFYNKKMGISNNNPQQFNSDIQGALQGKQDWKDVLSKYPEQAKKIMDIKFASDALNDGTTGARTSAGQQQQAPGNNADENSGLGQIKIQTSDGQIGFIPEANLPQALARGAKRLDQ